MSEVQLNPKYIEAVAHLVNRSPYFSLLSMEIKQLHWGTCLMEVELSKKHLQPFGNVHGGAIASVLDAAAFWAVFPQVERGKGLTTVEMKLNYLVPVQRESLWLKGDVSNSGGRWLWERLLSQTVKGPLLPLEQLQ